MVGSIVEWEQELQVRLRLVSPLAIVSGFYLMAIVVFAAARGRWRSSDEPSARIFRRQFAAHGDALQLRTSAAGIFDVLAHYSFHLFSSYDTVIPATQRFAAEMGLSILGPPQWSCSCCRPVQDWLPRLEVLFLDFGLLLSLYTTFRIARSQSSRISTAIKACLPWALLIGLLFAAGIWIVLQPMQMRGMMPADEMRQCLLIAVVCLASPAMVRADGGAVRLSERQGGYQITAFTSPTPFRAGPVDISVLVQDAATEKRRPIFVSSFASHRSTGPTKR